jgi:hypothetical protein
MGDYNKTIDNYSFIHSFIHSFIRIRVSLNTTAYGPGMLLVRCRVI